MKKIYAQLTRGLKRAISMGGNQIVNSAPVEEEPEFSIDNILQQIEDGATEGLDKKLKPVLKSLLPLLKYASANSKPDLTGPLQDLCRQLR